MSDSAQMTKKYISGIRTKAKAAVDKIRSNGMSDEAECFHQLLILCESFEKNVERLVNIEKEKDVEINNLLSQSEYTQKILNALQNKVLVVESSKNALQTKLQDALYTSVALEKERCELSKTIADFKNQLRAANRNRDIACNKIKILETQLADKIDSLKISAQMLETHEENIKTLKNSIQKQHTEFIGMAKERDRCVHEIEINVNKLKKKEAQLMEVNETLAKSKASQEQCRLQSIDLNRRVEASVSEIIAMRRDIKILNKSIDEIEQDRRRINIEKDALTENVSRLEMNFNQAQKEIEQLKRTGIIQKTDLERSFTKNKMLNASLQEKSQEIIDLNNAISSSEKSVAKLYSRLEDRQNEKDFVGTQIIRRNDEIALLAEKLEVTQLALDRGESQYNDRLEDIRRLTIDSKNSRATVDVLKANAVKMENWKNRIAILERELEEKKFENARLLNELETPINVHRWRHLSGHDPNRMELIQKIQILQKRILNQTAVVADKEKMLIAANRLFNSFKMSLCDTKVITMKTELIKARRALNQRTKRLKSLKAESRARELESAPDVLIT